MPSSLKIRLGTRASSLARWQANWVRNQLVRLGISVELVPISTSGDRQRQMSVGSLGTQGVFTKELQHALLDQSIDIAVHSLKDLPTEPMDGLCLAAVPPRGNVQDVLVSSIAMNVDELPSGARIATGSLRRRTQLRHLRSDFQLVDIRGNVDTRLRKLDEGHCDALVLAAAGLERLELSDRVTQVLPLSIMLPAVGQGALGIEARSEDHTVREALAPLDDPLTNAAVTAERTMLAELRGGCLAPVGGLAKIYSGRLYLRGTVLSMDGSRRLDASADQDQNSAAQIGQLVAQDLLEQGAAELIVESRNLE